MKLKELLTRIQGTQIQQEALIKNYIGSNIEIHTGIVGIDDTHIAVGWSLSDHQTFGDDYIIEDGDLSIHIHYEKAKFETQLLSYSRRDEVMITAKLCQAHFYGYREGYEFELVSIRKISTYVEREKAEEAEREARRKAEEEAERKRKQGCFIATACYGNYNAPEVLLLRQYRDDKLLKTFFGKVFVKFYYSVSPPFATLISKSDLLKKSMRQYFLEPLVTKLQRQNKC